MKACGPRQEQKLILPKQPVHVWLTCALILQYLVASTVVTTQIEGLILPLNFGKAKEKSPSLCSTAKNAPTTETSVETTIQVCGSKDCTRRGGGARLEKVIREIVEENALSSTIVEKCDCLGECGYGPNIMMNVQNADGTSSRLINQMRGREAIFQVLGLSSNENCQAEDVIQGNSVNGFSENRSRSLRWHDTGIIPRVCSSYRVPLMVSELPNVLQTPQIHWTTLFMISSKFGGRDDDDDETFVNVDDEFCPTDDEDDAGDQVLGEELDTASVVVEDIHWRVAKLRLEEQNTRRFLKSRPRFLPYNECRKWVQALGRFQTEEDWKEWISMGEKRNSYIPSRPDEYYGRLGQWISWDHFLLERKHRKRKDCDTDAFL